MEESEIRNPRCEMLPRRSRQRGSVYILVLGVSLLVTVLGVSALMAVRVERDRASLDRDAQQARRLAESAIDLAMLKINTNPNWRTTYTHDTWTGERMLGDGTINWKLVDPIDVDLANDVAQHVELVALGKLGDARQMVRVTLEPPAGQALDALNYALAATGRVKIASGASLSVAGGAGISAGQFDNSGTLLGDVVMGALDTLGLVSGDAVVVADPLEAPAADTIGAYIRRATPLIFTGDIDRMVIAPGRNDYGGATDADGVYYIDTGGSDITIRRSRVHGTLVIDAGAGAVRLRDTLLMQPYREDLATLIVRGDLEVEYSSTGAASQRLLIESVQGVNFNPAGVAYQGITDSDQSDSYPSEVQGLVHVTGDVRLASSGRLRGGLLVGGAVSVTADPQFAYDLDTTVPIWGYTTGGVVPMTIVPGSWARVVQ